jgi:hypothetical protein
VGLVLPEARTAISVLRLFHAQVRDHIAERAIPILLTSHRSVDAADVENALPSIPDSASST